MALLQKKDATQQGLEELVASGQLPASVLKIPGKPSREEPLPDH